MDIGFIVNTIVIVSGSAMSFEMPGNAWHFNLRIPNPARIQSIRQLDLFPGLADAASFLVRFWLSKAMLNFGMANRFPVKVRRNTSV